MASLCIYVFIYIAGIAFNERRRNAISMQINSKHMSVNPVSKNCSS